MAAKATGAKPAQFHPGAAALLGGPPGLSFPAFNGSATEFVPQGGFPGVVPQENPPIRHVSKRTPRAPEASSAANRYGSVPPHQRYSPHAGRAHVDRPQGIPSTPAATKSAVSSGMVCDIH